MTGNTKTQRTRKEISELCMNMLLGSTFKVEGERFGVKAEQAAIYFRRGKREALNLYNATANDDGSIFYGCHELAKIRKNKDAIECFKQRLYRWQCAEL